MSWVVMKFGGTSVSTVSNWENIAAALRQRMEDGERPLVVCSAFAGVSDQLEALVPAAVLGQHEALLAEIRDAHLRHAHALGVPASLLDEAFDTLSRLAQGAQLIGEASPRLKARILAQGELMSTRVGVAWLQGQGLAVGWLDARELLQSVPEPNETAARATLSASCHDDEDEAIQALLDAREEPALLTQGFIARDPAGHTVLLGRGGSDTTAAYLAARVSASRCEIWTDVPGLYTANPRTVPGARLLKALTYDEAQEIASTGAKVLHPRCIPPLRKHGIPLHIRCTPHPDAEHTVIAAAQPDVGARVKAVSAKTGVTLVSMATAGMWQQVGFLADVFAVFKRHGLSIDLVSTSEMNVTVSLDPGSNLLEPAALEVLLAELSTYCRARVIGPCAAVSLVGQRIRALLHKLGPALQAFEEQRVHLVSQAASDLNLTLVVGEDQADRLVQRLHQLLFPSEGDNTWLGPSWEERFGTPSPIKRAGPRWWQSRSAELLALAEYTPLYVYDRASVDRNAAALASLASVDRVFYAIKANAHPELLEGMAAAGLGFECVSPGELRHVLALFPDLDRERVLFTPNFAPRPEYEEAFAAGVHVTLDNLHPLRAWPELFANRSVLLRVDPGQGRGHHHYVRTAGAQSKFGVWPEELPELKRRLDAVQARVIGLHAHTGSGIRIADTWRDTALFLLGVAEQFPEATILNLGGGLGVSERPGEPELDLGALDQSLAEIRSAHPALSLWLEPGRYLVANAGVLLARVTQVKQKGSVRYVGVDAGMNSLIRPALYGAWHGIVNLSRLGDPRTETANIVGPICESGDTLGYDRQIAPAREGDVLLIDTAGAYGWVMSSQYNLRLPAAERVI